MYDQSFNIFYVFIGSTESEAKFLEMAATSEDAVLYEMMEE